MTPPYEHARPRQLLRVEWSGGRHRFYNNIDQVWNDALHGNMPVHERGSRLVPIPDDGTREWSEIYERAEKGPVFG